MCKIVKIVIEPHQSGMCPIPEYSCEMTITENAFIYSCTERYYPDSTRDTNVNWRYESNSPAFKECFKKATEATMRVFIDHELPGLITDLGTTTFTFVCADGKESSTDVYGANYCPNVRKLYNILRKMIPACDRPPELYIPRNS